MFKKDDSSEGGIQDTIIAQGVKVEGEFDSQGNVVVEGEVHGSLHTERELRVGEQARIIANVVAENAIVSGEVQGNIKVNDRLELTPTSRISGDIEAKTISIAPGAILNGRCSMPGGPETVNISLGDRRRSPRNKMVAAVEAEEPQMS